MSKTTIISHIDKCGMRSAECGMPGNEEVIVYNNIFRNPNSTFRN
jgi:hypothetical protein